MVRVNLLPDKRGQAGRGRTRQRSPGSSGCSRSSGPRSSRSSCCLFVQKIEARTSSRGILGENDVAQGQIDAIKPSRSPTTRRSRRELKELRDREDAIQKLQSARTGPTSALLELAHVLTAEASGPTTDRDKLEQLKRDNPAVVYNANWDPRRLWLTSYKEADRIVKIDGLARDGEDVAEFERRLKLSDYFYDVKLLPGAEGGRRDHAPGALPVRAQREGEVLTWLPPRPLSLRSPSCRRSRRSASAPRSRSSCFSTYWFIFYSDVAAQDRGRAAAEGVAARRARHAATGRGHLLRRPRRAGPSRATGARAQQGPARRSRGGRVSLERAAGVERRRGSTSRATRPRKRSRRASTRRSR